MSECDTFSSAVRILVVDDFERWRQYLIGELRASDDRFNVVGEASDGPEALQKVGLLKPTLILLDVGLPSEDGIKVASRILQTAPESKILMISAHNSAAIVRSAFRAGAHGYLMKSDAGRELLPAIEAILRGDLFVSSRILTASESEHSLQFYSADRSLAGQHSDLVGRALPRRGL